ncbi:hypothetical protein CY34DRAFT_804463 [Suillus luteus UH-Slu-Lm8-n1]|uniref:Uncharacterized protein n=1 Tax=Suillus luteus UH-Slu-Lm8-n1 TaxID=930992 RepID=A0A0D0B991_9AGAM|nr:hypothetical protein CY34DRAFT_804463 [Suillus luteus UH-Slu-Lm8-n1]
MSGACLIYTEWGFMSLARQSSKTIKGYRIGNPYGLRRGAQYRRDKRCVLVVTLRGIFQSPAAT